VVFEANARNNWHTHGSNQILIVTQGVGYYQEEGSPIREFLPDLPGK
jgi:quercetin dioxygenase-like cupin family protein